MAHRLLIIFAILFSCLNTFSQEQQETTKKRSRKMYVFAVGVSDYRDPRIHDLTKPTFDADTIASIFRNPNNEVFILKDSTASGDSVRAKMERFFSKATKNDNILFFFSGHGTTRGFCCYDYMKYGGALTYGDIRNIFNKSKVHSKFIFADACYSGDLRSQSQKMKEELPTSDEKTQQQVVLFLSSRGNEVSYESPMMKNGYFTTYLVEALNGKADANSNGNITAIELYNYVSKKLNKALGGNQHCVMWGNFNKKLIVTRVINPNE